MGTQWVIAELRDQARIGNDRFWLYAAPTQLPPDVPPMGGWEVPRRSRASPPAPEVRLVARENLRRAPQLPGDVVVRGLPAARERAASPPSTPPEPFADAAPVEEALPPRCYRCGPPCSIM